MVKKSNTFIPLHGNDCIILNIMAKCSGNTLSIKKNIEKKTEKKEKFESIQEDI